MRNKKGKRKTVLTRDGFQCQYCGVRLTEKGATVDHMTPLGLGGSNANWNLVTCCQTCNHAKGDNLPLVFLNRHNGFEHRYRATTSYMPIVLV